MSEKDLVLIVDDDTLILERREKQFRNSKYELITALNGTAALIAYQSRPEIVLAIFDTQLGHEKGWDVYLSLRDNGYNGAALGMSGGSYLRAWRNYGVDFLNKHVGREELFAKVDELVAAYKKENRSH